MNDQLFFDHRYLAQLEALSLESRRKFLGARQGGHLSLKKGQGLEFSDYRAYQLGDNPRYIDWKAYGRTEKLFIKQFQEEQDMLVSVLLDGSASMGAETDIEKWIFARRLALSFCYIGLKQQDKVALTILGRPRTLSLSSPQSFPQFIKMAAEASTPSANNSFGAELKSAALRLKFPGVAIVISDFHCSLEELDIGFRQLKARNLDIVAIQVLGEKDLAPVEINQFSQLIDSETGEQFDIEYTTEKAKELKQLVDSHRLKCREYFRQRQIGFTTLVSNQDIVATFRKSQSALRIIR